MLEDINVLQYIMFIFTSFLNECSSLTLIASTSTSISTDTDSIWNILNYDTHKSQWLYN